MKQKILLRFALLIVVFAVQLHAEAPKLVSEVPIVTDYGLVFFQMRVNDSGPYWFQLDTGFDVNVLNASLVKPLKLSLENKQEIPAPGGTIEIGTASGVRFELPGVELADQTVTAVPLDPLLHFIGRPLDGILGHDFISRYALEVDYANRKMRIYQAEGFSYSGPGEILPVTVKEKEPFVKVDVLMPSEYTAQGMFKVDTGSLDVMGMNKNFLDEHEVLQRVPKSIEMAGVAVGGETKGVLFRVSALKLGGFSIPEPVVGATLDSKGFENRADAGTIGGALLGQFKVIFDFSKDRMILEKGPGYGTRPASDLSGLWLVTAEKDFAAFQVFQVIESSPAATAGFQVGDALQTVDGRAAGSYQLADLWRMLRGKPGEVHTFEVGRAEKTVRLKLTLAPYL